MVPLIGFRGLGFWVFSAFGVFRVGIRSFRVHRVLSLELWSFRLGFAQRTQFSTSRRSSLVWRGRSGSFHFGVGLEV